MMVVLFLLVVMDIFLLVCVFYFLDLFMIGRGVFYYGVYVCIVYCLLVKKVEGR